MPNEHGSPTISPKRITIHKRTDTKTLLGSDYQTVVLSKDIPSPPRPFEDASHYSKEALKVRLIYADRTLRNSERRLSPIGMHALTLYKDACAPLYDFEEGEISEEGQDGFSELKHELLAVVRLYENSLQYTACLNLTNTKDAQSLQDQLISLQRLNFYSRYGDYFAEACRNLKTTADRYKVVGSETLRNYWMNINSNLSKEKGAYEGVLRGEKRHDECPTHMAVVHTCRRVGFSPDDMLAIIDLYATRNVPMHANFVPLIQQGQLDELKHQLYNDFCAIPLLLPPTETKLAALMKLLVESIIDLWYDRGDDDRDNIQLWSAKEELKNHYRDLRGPKPKKTEEEVNADIQKNVVKIVQQRLKEAASVKDTIAMMQESWNLLSAGQRVKRVASSALEEETVRAKQMQKRWSSIMKLAHNTRKLSDAYLDDYSELGPPPEIIHDPSLD